MSTASEWKVLRFPVLLFMKNKIHGSVDIVFTPSISVLQLWIEHASDELFVTERVLYDKLTPFFFFL